MTRVSATNVGAQTRPSVTSDAINDIDLGTFLQLLITELQNQDPLNPMDNKDMLAQISQIREVGATDKLTQTLNSVLLGQNIASSTNLIGAEVEGLSDDLQRVKGIVERISIAEGEPKLHLELRSEANVNGSEGELEAGKYAYRVVWQDENGKLVGIAMNHVQTTGDEGYDTAIELTNLPESSTPKFVYRTNKTGEGNFYQVGMIVDGKQSTYIDGLSDKDMSSNLLQGQIRTTDAFRKFKLSLKNVSDIRPPSTVTNPPVNNPPQQNPADEPLSGDYNQDGSVDAADYVLWRKNPAAFEDDP